MSSPSSQPSATAAAPSGNKKRTGSKRRKQGKQSSAHRPNGLLREVSEVSQETLTRRALEHRRRMARKRISTQKRPFQPKPLHQEEFSFEQSRESHRQYDQYGNRVAALQQQHQYYPPSQPQYPVHPHPEQYPAPPQIQHQTYLQPHHQHQQQQQQQLQATPEQGSDDGDDDDDDSDDDGEEQLHRGEEEDREVEERQSPSQASQVEDSTDPRPAEDDGESLPSSGPGEAEVEEEEDIPSSGAATPLSQEEEDELADDHGPPHRQPLVQHLSRQQQDYQTQQMQIQQQVVEYQSKFLLNSENNKNNSQPQQQQQQSPSDDHPQPHQQEEDSEANLKSPTLPADLYPHKSLEELKRMETELRKRLDNSSKEFKVLWRIQNFQEHQNKIYSPEYYFANHRWRLFAYPQGLDHTCRDYLSVFVEVLDLPKNDPSLCVIAKFTFSLVHPESLMEDKHDEHMRNHAPGCCPTETSAHNFSQAEPDRGWKKLAPLKALPQYVDSKGALTIALVLSNVTEFRQRTNTYNSKPASSPLGHPDAHLAGHPHHPVDPSLQHHPGLAHHHHPHHQQHPHHPHHHQQQQQQQQLTTDPDYLDGGGGASPPGVGDLHTGAAVHDYYTYTKVDVFDELEMVSAVEGIGHEFHPLVSKMRRTQVPSWKSIHNWMSMRIWETSCGIPWQRQQLWFLTVRENFTTRPNDMIRFQEMGYTLREAAEYRYECDPNEPIMLYLRDTLYDSLIEPPTQEELRQYYLQRYERSEQQRALSQARRRRQQQQQQQQQQETKGLPPAEEKREGRSEEGRDAPLPEEEEEVGEEEEEEFLDEDLDRLAEKLDPEDVLEAENDLLDLGLREEKVLLILKFFDPRWQRMVLLGSGVFHVATTVRGVMNYARKLLLARPNSILDRDLIAELMPEVPALARKAGDARERYRRQQKEYELRKSDPQKTTSNTTDSGSSNTSGGGGGSGGKKKKKKKKQKRAAGQSGTGGGAAAAEVSSSAEPTPPPAPKYPSPAVGGLLGSNHWLDYLPFRVYEEEDIREGHLTQLRPGDSLYARRLTSGDILCLEVAWPENALKSLRTRLDRTWNQRKAETLDMVLNQSLRGLGPDTSHLPSPPPGFAGVDLLWSPNVEAFLTSSANGQSWEWNVHIQAVWFQRVRLVELKEQRADEAQAELFALLSEEDRKRKRKERKKKQRDKRKQQEQQKLDKERDRRLEQERKEEERRQREAAAKRREEERRKREEQEKERELLQQLQRERRELERQERERAEREQRLKREREQQQQRLQREKEQREQRERERRERERKAREQREKERRQAEQKEKQKQQPQQRQQTAKERKSTPPAPPQQTASSVVEARQEISSAPRVSQSRAVSPASSTASAPVSKDTSESRKPSLVQASSSSPVTAATPEQPRLSARDSVSATAPGPGLSVPETDAPVTPVAVLGSTSSSSSPLPVSAVAAPTVSGRETVLRNGAGTQRPHHPQQQQQQQPQQPRSHPPPHLREQPNDPLYSGFRGQPTFGLPDSSPMVVGGEEEGILLQSPQVVGSSIPDPRSGTLPSSSTAASDALQYGLEGAFHDDFLNQAPLAAVRTGAGGGPGIPDLQQKDAHSHSHDLFGGGGGGGGDPQTASQRSAVASGGEEGGRGYDPLSGGFSFLTAFSPVSPEESGDSRKGSSSGYLATEQHRHQLGGLRSFGSLPGMSMDDRLTGGGVGHMGAVIHNNHPRGSIASQTSSTHSVPSSASPVGLEMDDTDNGDLPAGIFSLLDEPDTGMGLRYGDFHSRLFSSSSSSAAASSSSSSHPPPQPPQHHSVHPSPPQPSQQQHPNRIPGAPLPPSSTRNGQTRQFGDGGGGDAAGDLLHHGRSHHHLSHQPQHRHPAQLQPSHVYSQQPRQQMHLRHSHPPLSHSRLSSGSLPGYDGSVSGTSSDSVSGGSSWGSGAGMISQPQPPAAPLFGTGGGDGSAGVSFHPPSHPPPPQAARNNNHPAARIRPEHQSSSRHSQQHFQQQQQQQPYGNFPPPPHGNPGYPVAAPPHRHQSHNQHHPTPKQSLPRGQPHHFNGGSSSGNPEEHQWRGYP